jgi:hypothetical protein
MSSKKTTPTPPAASVDATPVPMPAGGGVYRRGSGGQLEKVSGPAPAADAPATESNPTGADDEK